MSIRTIVEINHDYLHELIESAIPGTQLHEFLSALRSSAKPWDYSGLRHILQRHHSSKVTIEVE